MCDKYAKSNEEEWRGQKRWHSTDSGDSLDLLSTDPNTDDQIDGVCTEVQ